MKIETHNNVVTVTGHIRTQTDSQEIKDAISQMIDSGQKQITLSTDAITLMSDLIGFLTKVRRQGVSLNIIARDPTCYELLLELNMQQQFNVQPG